MNFLLLVCINLFGIPGIIGLTYLAILLISKRKDSFKLQPNRLLLGTLISFSISLTIITSGISLSFHQNSFFIILIIILCMLLVVTPVVVFFVFLAYYIKSISIEENSVQVL